MIFFNNCDIRVEGTGVMASQVTITSQSPVIPVRTVGRNRAHVAAGGFYQNSLKFSYFVNIDEDPCFARVTDLKNTINFSGLSSQTIECAGVTGSYYLQSYQISVPESDIVQATVSFVGYELVTGELRDKVDQYDYIQSGFSGFAHAWTAKLSSDDGELDVPLYDFNYNYKAGIKPIYVIGKKFPTQVQFLTSEEEINIIRDRYKPLTFAGESGNVIFGVPEAGEIWHAPDNNPRIKLLKLATLCDDKITDAIEIDVSDSTFESTSMTINTNDFVTINMSATRYY